MKRTFKNSILIVLVASLMIVSFALLSGCGEETPEVSYDYFTFYYDAELNGLVLSSVKISSLPTAVVVPASHAFDRENGDGEKQYQVVAIANEAFSYASNIVSVSLPDTLKSVGDKAFYECTKLSTINLENVTTIGKEAFAYNKALASVTLSTDLKQISDKAFYGTSSLKSVSGSAKLQSIGEEAFSGAVSLIDLSYDSSALKTIGAKAFFYTGGLTTFTIPSSCDSVGTNAFEGWTKYQTVNYYSDSNFSSDWKGGVSDQSIFVKL